MKSRKCKMCQSYHRLARLQTSAYASLNDRPQLPSRDGLAHVPPPPPSRRGGGALFWWMWRQRMLTSPASVVSTLLEIFS